MEIGEEIHQKQFKTPQHRVILNILFTASWLELQQTHFFKKWGISPQQYNLLRILRGMHPEPSTVASIQERMIDKMSNASRLVDKLVLKKMVKRKTSPVDRRSVEIRITDSGLSLLNDIDPFLEGEELNTNKLNNSDAENLSALLDKLRG